VTRSSTLAAVRHRTYLLGWHTYSLKAFNIEEALKTEHYEMVSYQGLITLASELGNDEALSLLSENLTEEENAAQLLERERIGRSPGRAARR
jgi:ferritin-like metal-binding protein YciE